MALVGRRDGRNFGYGRQLSYAGPQALKDLFGGRHYGTVKAHRRWTSDGQPLGELSRETFKVQAIHVIEALRAKWR